MYSHKWNITIWKLKLIYNIHIFMPYLLVNTVSFDWTDQSVMAVWTQWQAYSAILTASEFLTVLNVSTRICMSFCGTHIVSGRRTAVQVKWKQRKIEIIVFWDVKPCSLVEAQRRISEEIEVPHPQSWGLHQNFGPLTTATTTPVKFLLYYTRVEYRVSAKLTRQINKSCISTNNLISCRRISNGRIEHTSCK